MSITLPQGYAPNASLGDCVRLFRTLTDEYIPGLRIEMIPALGVDNQPCVRVELVDYSELRSSAGLDRSVWARKVFYSPLYLISHTQLFDLLIVGYRVIVEYFSTGKDNRPPCL